ncbi:MAG: peptidylprolyl isomerase [Planctomycetota bacterium]
MSSSFRRKVVIAFAFVVAFLTRPILAQESDPPRVELETSMGKIVLELNPDKAPKTVENFLKYVKDDHYKDTIFHRVIDGFMVQTGGMGSDMVERKTRPPVINEAGNGLSNKKFTIAMARTRDPNSATSQFFINVADNDFLNRSARDAGYAVFGKVVEGTDVVEKISKVPTRTVAAEMLLRYFPYKPVFIKKATVVEK